MKTDFVEDPTLHFWKLGRHSASWKVRVIATVAAGGWEHIVLRREQLDNNDVRFYGKCRLESVPSGVILPTAVQPTWITGLHGG
jgi:hypothetical protein